MNEERPENYWDPNGPADAGLPPTSPTAPAATNPVPEGLVELPPTVIAWQASEYLEHSNGFGWYAAFFGVVFALIALSVWRQFWTFTAVIIVMAVAGIIHVRRPPRILQYVLDDDGLQIGEKMHAYEEFKSFALVRDGAFYGIMLIPVRRFLPATLVYFAEEDGERIVDAFGARLPMEDRDLDPVDKFLRKIRF